MLPRLKTRAAFLAGNASRRRFAADGLVLQVVARKGADADTDSNAAPLSAGGVSALPPIRVGFTATKKLGNAVVRNRVKRRLRALADRLLPLHAKPGLDYVLIGRIDTAARDFALLESDLMLALERTNARRAAEPEPAS